MEKGSHQQTLRKRKTHTDRATEKDWEGQRRMQRTKLKTYRRIQTKQNGKQQNNEQEIKRTKTPNSEQPFES